MDDPEPKREGGRAARRVSDTHKRLLQAALSVFNELGFDACAIEDITEKADVGKGTFYRHFHDKHTILSALVELAVQDLESRIAKPHPSPFPPADTVSVIVREHIAMFRERRDLFLLFLQTYNMMAVSTGAHPELQISFTRYWTIIETGLASATPPNATSETPRLSAAVVSGSIFGIIMAGLSAMPIEAFDNKLEHLCNAIVAGINQNLRCAV